MSKAGSVVSVVASLVMMAAGIAGVWHAWRVLDRVERLDAAAAKRAAGQFDLGQEMHFPGYDFSIQTADSADILVSGNTELRAPAGRQFVLVVADITNTGQAPLTFTWLSAVQLIDADGVAHNHDMAASQAYADGVAEAGLTLYGYGKTITVDPGGHKAGVLLFDLPAGRFDRQTWQIGLRGQTVRVSLKPSPPDPNAPIYDPVF